jgi:uncharacterized membrane protein SpoIIM required for sporulation
LVLEALVDAEAARRNPLAIIALSAAFASIAVVVVQFLNFGQSSDVLLLVFTIIPSIPFLLNLVKYGEREAREAKRFLGSTTLARHAPAIITLAAFFFGLTLAFTAWYVALPSEASKALFAIQTAELENVKAVSSQLAGAFLNARFLNAFELIFLHNLQVLLLAVGFSLLYGAGAVFILTWNASIIGVFLGSIAKAGGSAMAGASALGIFPHGLFELLAYSTGALAGGILSHAMVTRKINKLEFFHVVYDAAKLTGWAILFLAVAAFIESSGAAA